MTGSEFFSSYSGDNKKKKVDDLCKQTQEIQLEWEQKPASELSPGVVLDQELLVRGVLDPIHMDGDQIKPAVFDDISSHGLSVHRLDYLALEDIMSSQQSRVDRFNADKEPQKPARSLVGYLRLSTADLRQIVLDGRRAFGIYDTAIPEDKSHAEACLLVPSKQARRSARATLFELGKSGFNRC